MSMGQAILSSPARKVYRAQAPDGMRPLPRLRQDQHRLQINACWGRRAILHARLDDRGLGSFPPIPGYAGRGR